jgi:hypothetical protein
MRVFISWAGDLSYQIAVQINEWLPSALQNVKPWFSGNIKKGAHWQTELFQNLEDTKFSIIVLTREALKSDWIMFETGATAKAVGESHACPVLFGIEPADVVGPLASFQHTRFVRDDFFKLFGTINGAIGDGKLEQSTLSSVFEKWWPDLEKRVTEILASSPQSKRKRRDTAEIIEEILVLVRGMQRSLEVGTLEPRIRDYIQNRDDSGVLAALIHNKDVFDTFYKDSLRGWLSQQDPDTVQKLLDDAGKKWVEDIKKHGGPSKTNE